MAHQDQQAIADVVVLTVKAALGPLLERLASLEANASAAARSDDALSDLGRRVTLAETKAASFQPQRDDALADAVAMAVRDATAPLTERLALAEAKLASLGALDASVTAIRERVVVAETKIAVLPQPVTPPAVDLSPVLERVKALEGKGTEHYPSVDCRLTSSLVHGLDKELAGLRDRVQAIETKAASFETRPIPPDPIAPALERTERAVAELSKDFGLMRERMAAVETRQPVPGPAGLAGKDGAPGRDGVDGVGFDDLSVVPVDERSWVIKAARGERVKDIGTIRIPAQIQRGVWVEGKSYETGDVVTWAGSQFCANEPTSTKPETSKAWTLVVKRGRDGKDGKDAAGALPVVSVGGAR